MPQLVLARALQGHPDTALTFRYDVGPWHAAFRSGKAPSGAESTTASLHNGWTVETFASAAAGGIFANANASALLVAGIVMSLLLAALSSCWERVASARCGWSVSGLANCAIKRCMMA